METEQRFGRKALLFSLIRHGALGVSFLLFTLFTLIIFSLNIVNIPSILLTFTFTLILLLISVVTIAGGCLVAILSYRNKTFVLGRDALILKHGIVTREEISVPYKEIKDIHGNQSALERIIGVTNLQLIEGEGHRHKEALKGIQTEIAENLRSEILKRISQNEMPGRTAEKISPELEENRKKSAEQNKTEHLNFKLEV